VQDYQQHQHWTSLSDFEQSLVHLLFASQGSTQPLPCRDDQKIGEGVIVAAESWADQQPILVIARDEDLDSWIDLWERCGEHFVDGRQYVGDHSVNFATIEEIKDDFYLHLNYGVIVMAASYSQAEVTMLTDRLLSFERCWWVVPQDVPVPWSNGAAAQWLLADTRLESVSVKPGRRSRPSGLASARLALQI
jgi:hypothetical protein